MVVQAGPAARTGQGPIGRRKRPRRGRGEELRQTGFLRGQSLLVVPHSFPGTAESRSERLSELAPLLEVVNEARDVYQPVLDALPEPAHESEPTAMPQMGAAVPQSPPDGPPHRLRLRLGFAHLPPSAPAHLPAAVPPPPSVVDRWWAIPPESREAARLQRPS